MKPHPMPRSTRYRLETERALARMLARASRPGPAARMAARLILRAVVDTAVVADTATGYRRAA